MTEESLIVVGTALIVMLLSSSLFSLSRAVMAERAKTRLKALIAGRMPADQALSKLSYAAANGTLDRNEIDRALEQMEINLDRLSSTDKALLEPGLNKNTLEGSRRFVTEMLVTKRASAR